MLSVLAPAAVRADVVIGVSGRLCVTPAAADATPLFKCSPASANSLLFWPCLSSATAGSQRALVFCTQTE